MPIVNLTKQSIDEALQYIDDKGIPEPNRSTKYELVTENGKKYPPKYTIAVADHIQNGKTISTDGFNSIEAKNYLKNLGYNIETKQEKFELTITTENVISTDEDFSMDAISLGDRYVPLEAYYKKGSGEKIIRHRNKGEKRISNQTMPRIACQLFEKQLTNMSIEEKEKFPVCRYTLNGRLIHGIFPSVEEFKKHINTIEYMNYQCENGVKLFFYCWNIFSTIIFVQECIKRFGNPDDKMILIYREKDEKEKKADENNVVVTTSLKESEQQQKNYRNPLSKILTDSKNIILRGAPGTGKTYIAREIATDIVSNGYYDKYSSLRPEQKQQVEFVQFHPNYDYSDFVEGLRPKLTDNGSMEFELRDGVFKKFIKRAIKNYEEYKKSKEELKPYIFIIDEINRGEISKIFGELFFSIDPGYRGEEGEITTQYANLHANPDEKFYIPENVYIIGTMNDIDRSVDSFDFAMRRRFRFIEMKANECIDMLDNLGNEDKRDKAYQRMKNLNDEIAKIEDLNENYQIGAAYFLKLKYLSEDQLWTDYLEPLLKEYVHGMYDEEGIINRLAKAYGYTNKTSGETNESINNQG